MPPIGIAHAPKNIQHITARREIWEQLQSLHKYNSLNDATINLFKK